MSEMIDPPDLLCGPLCPCKDVTPELLASLKHSITATHPVHDSLDSQASSTQCQLSQASGEAVLEDAPTTSQQKPTEDKPTNSLRRLDVQASPRILVSPPPSTMTRPSSSAQSTPKSALKAFAPPASTHQMIKMTYARQASEAALVYALRTVFTTVWKHSQERKRKAVELAMKQQVQDGGMKGELETGQTLGESTGNAGDVLGDEEIEEDLDEDEEKGSDSDVDGVCKGYDLEASDEHVASLQSRVCQPKRRTVNAEDLSVFMEELGLPKNARQSLLAVLEAGGERLGVPRSKRRQIMQQQQQQQQQQSHRQHQQCSDIPPSSPTITTSTHTTGITSTANTPSSLPSASHSPSLSTSSSTSPIITLSTSIPPSPHRFFTVRQLEAAFVRSTTTPSYRRLSSASLALPSVSETSSSPTPSPSLNRARTTRANPTHSSSSVHTTSSLSSTTTNSSSSSSSSSSTSSSSSPTTSTPSPSPAASTASESSSTTSINASTTTSTTSTTETSTPYRHPSPQPLPDSITLGPPVVFLGGVCGSTVWRTQIAIPRFDQVGVTYYNPHVADWRPELMALESLMKAWCTVNLFVIDGSTRGVASMVEASGLISEGRNVVLVLTCVEQDSVVDGVTLSKQEIRDLNRGREYLREVAQTHKAPCYDTVQQACDHVIEMVRRAALLEEVDEEDGEDENDDGLQGQCESLVT